MKTILLATHNKGKIKRYKALFKSIKNLKIITLSDLEIDMKVDEPFNSPEENSAYKASQYGKLSNLPTIAVDEAVETNFLPDNEQPGVFVRRLHAKRELSDTEVLTKWRDLFLKYPIENKKFIWDFKMSYYDPKSNEIQTSGAVQIDTVALEFSNIITPGYPMSSFLVPKGFTKPYSELNKKESLVVDKINLRLFFELIKKIALD